MLWAVPAGRRGALFQAALSFRPSPTLEGSFTVGFFRAAVAEYWEQRFGNQLPIRQLRWILEPPVPIQTVLAFNKLALAADPIELDQFIEQLVHQIHNRICSHDSPQQTLLFQVADAIPAKAIERPSCGRSVQDLMELVCEGKKFPTIYADPPWPYLNEASRGAAVNHYPTMSIDEIRNQHVRPLAEANSHLHLWTTNAFLREAFDVINCWGFDFRSCLVWIKPELGMGNYWRVSHEFLLLGVRGSLTFRDRTLPSWILADRTLHSRKPGRIRALVERVSPGPYLELFGREELPDSEWTVYGNEVERRFC